MSLTGYSFGLEEAWIAPWSGQATYGTAIQLVACEIFDVTFDTVNGELRGDDQIIDVFAKTISAKIRIKFGFNDLAVLPILTGETVVDSSPTSKSVVFHNTVRPYFGIVGRIDQSQGGGDIQLFIPKAKITGGFGPLTMSFGNYLTPQLDAMAITDGSPYYMGKLIKHATATTPTIPPT